MITNCNKCGSIFTKQEIKEFIKQAEYCDVIFICQHCYEQQGNYEENEHPFYRDSDSGL